MNAWPEASTTIVLRLQRPLNPELPAVEAGYVDGQWVCEDDFVRRWLEHETEIVHWFETYVFYPEWTASQKAIEFLKAEIILENFDDEDDDLGEDGRPIVY